MWYFERVGLLSHLPGLVLKANVGLNESATSEDGQNHQEEEIEGNRSKTQMDPAWSAADERNVTVKTLWDNTRHHDEVKIPWLTKSSMQGSTAFCVSFQIGPPCYALWQQGSEQHSPLVSALVTEHQPFPRRFERCSVVKTFQLDSPLLFLDSVLQQLLSGIQYNDMLRPLKLLSSELVKRRTKTGAVARHHGIYRELLFLSFVAIGRENIDQSKEDSFENAQLDSNNRPVFGHSRFRSRVPTGVRPSGRSSRG